MTNGLRSTIRTWKFPRYIKPPDRPQLAKTTRRLQKQREESTMKPITGLRLEELHDRVRDNVRMGQPLRGLSQRDLKSLPWVLFLPSKSPEDWLARDRELRRAYAAWIEDRGKARAIGALVHVLLQHWDGDEAYFDGWRAITLLAVQGSTKRRLEKIRHKCREYHLLARNGPERFVAYARQQPALDPSILADAGLAGQLEYSAFVKTALARLIEVTRGTLVDDGMYAAELERVLNLMRHPEHSGLRFEALRLPLVRSLLTPFQELSPSPEMQELILDFVLANVGDPRFKKSGWQGLDRSLRDVVLRWLVRITLDDFFRILDRTAIDRMWRQRKEFWSAYLDRGAITDAWLVLGGKARELARKAQDGQAGWGNLDGFYDHKQSVLLMRLAGLTIAEWSHNGKVCFWKSANPQRPELYESGKYNADSLRDKNGADESFVHVHTGAWMGRVERYVRRETGVKRVG